MPSLALVPNPPNCPSAETAVARFIGDERGSLLVFGLLFFVLVLGFTGMAVDVARFEAERTALQNAIDRGVLAATDLDQTMDSEGVVRDYLEKAGYDGDAADVTVTETGIGSLTSGRRVEATLNFQSSTFFMPLLGFDELGTAVSGAATEAVTNIEIVMVLDTSGSMSADVPATDEYPVMTRMEHLKGAAVDFVEAMLPADAADQGPGLTSIAIVPYSMSVNLGEDLAALYTLSDEHDYSNCVYFDDADFQTLGIDRSDDNVLRRFTHFDHGNHGTENGEIVKPLCPRGDRNAIVPPTTDRGDLLDAIDALEPYSSTGIDVGMKWGLALLDDSSRSVVSDLIASGAIANDDIEGRPAAYGSDANDWKVVVLMTDGNNDPQRDVREELRTGVSPIFYHADDHRFSVLVKGRYAVFCDTDGDGEYEDGEHDPGFVTEEQCTDDDNEDEIEDRDIVWYWVDNREHRGNANYDGSFHGHPYSSVRDQENRRDEWQHLAGELTQLDWIDVWNRVHERHFYERFFEEPRDEGRRRGETWVTNSERHSYRNVRAHQTEREDTEARLREICELAKVEEDFGDGETRERVRVFSVILDAEKDSYAELLKSCATVRTRDAFDVRGGEIKKAFNVIANSISELRLVQ